jgi:hypothetical protein
MRRGQSGGDDGGEVFTGEERTIVGEVAHRCIVTG